MVDEQALCAPGIRARPGEIMTSALQPHFECNDLMGAFNFFRRTIPQWSAESLVEFIERVAGLADVGRSPDGRFMFATGLLTRCLDGPVRTGSKKRSSVRQLIKVEAVPLGVLGFTQSYTGT